MPWWNINEWYELRRQREVQAREASHLRYVEEMERLRRQYQREKDERQAKAEAKVEAERLRKQGAAAIEEARKLREAEEAELVRRVQEAKRCQQEEEERKRRDEAKRREQEEAERKRLQALRERAASWQHRIHLERNFLDADYRERFAKTHQVKIVQDLAPTWAKEYQAFMQGELFAHLTERDPVLLRQIVEWLEARHETVLAAEHFAVTPEAKPTKQRWTAEQIRAFKLRHQRAWMEDKIASTKQTIEKILELRKDLDQYDLDPDERTRIEAELVEQILEGGNEHANGKTI